MKIRGNVTGAVVSLAVFLAFAIAGGICLAAGFGELVANSDVINNVNDLVEYVDDFSLNVNVSDKTEKATAYYVRELSEDVEKVVIATEGCSVNVRSGSEFSVDFSGSVNQGKFAVLNESDEPNATESEFDAAYYDHSGIINASFEDGVLKISIDAALEISGININVNANIGHITVTIPNTYTGSLELRDSFAEIGVAGLDFNELTLINCLGETDIHGGSIQMLNITNMAGEVDVDDCRVSGVHFENIAGEIDVSSDAAFTADSIVSDIAGEVNIDLPRGSQLNVTKDDILGEVGIDRAIVGSDTAPALDISDVMGEVVVEIDD